MCINHISSDVHMQKAFIFGGGSPGSALNQQSLMLIHLLINFVKHKLKHIEYHLNHSGSRCPIKYFM